MNFKILTFSAEIHEFISSSPALCWMMRPKEAGTSARNTVATDHKLYQEAEMLRNFCQNPSNRHGRDIIRHYVSHGITQ